MNNSLDISAARHSLAHVMAAAVQRLYGAGVKFGVGPAIENGFIMTWTLTPRELRLVMMI